MTRSTSLGLLAFASAVSGWCRPSAARRRRVTSASVTGTVRDASDGVVPGATVEIVNAETNQASRR